jgi:hypothetical protein
MANKEIDFHDRLHGLQLQQLLLLVQVPCHAAQQIPIHVS